MYRPLCLALGLVLASPLASAADGYFVYAGARKGTDLAALGALKNVQARPRTS